MKTTMLIFMICGASHVLLCQTQPALVGPADLFLLSDARTRSVSPENLTGGKGKGGMTELEKGSAARAARELGRGWKVNPYVRIKPGETFAMADIAGPGMVHHIWMTPTGDYRRAIFRIYWDGEKKPSVEVPVGDFFCSGWGWENEPQINSLAVCVNPKNGFNCYWQMPFRKQCRVTMENLADGELIVYYQFDYSETAIPARAAMFHAQFRRVNPVKFKDVYTIVDGIKGTGHYVGTYLAHGANSPGWWGEGEVKFYLDGDLEFPTICGTGEEDYFNGSYGFEETTDRKGDYRYTDFSTPYSGFYHVRDGGNRTQQRRFGEYRWHIVDPIRFEKDLRVTIQCLGWQSEERYLPLQDDMASVAYWYQAEPHAPFPELPSKEKLALTFSDPVLHKGLSKRVELVIPPNPKYATNPSLLTDGNQGSLRFNDNCWIGFEESDVEAIVDLGTSTPISNVSASFLSDQGSAVFFPLEVDISTSDDGTTFHSIIRHEEPLKEEVSRSIRSYSARPENARARYVKVKARNTGTCPPWPGTPGGKAWLFIDEIVID